METLMDGTEFADVTNRITRFHVEYVKVLEEFLTETRTMRSA